MQILKVMVVIGQNVKQDNFMRIFQVVSFHKLKLTNNISDKSGFVSVSCIQSHHRVTSYPVTSYTVTSYPVISSSQSEHLVGFI